MGSGCSIHNSNANETIDRLIDYILQFVDDRSDIIDEIGNGNVHLSQTAFVHTSAVLKVILKQLSGVKRDTIVYCDIFGFEKAIDDAFQNGLTPIILDSSHDDKVCTFYSYQPNAIILEAKTLIVQSAKTSLEQSLEFCRRSLVNAMKFGKTMIVRLGTSAPDFRTTFNDSVLCRQGYDVLKPCSGYFPEEVFVKGGVGMFEDGVPERIFREEDMKPHKNFAFCRQGFRVLLASQIPVENVDKYLFGSEWGGLPDKKYFQIICVRHVDEDADEIIGAGKDELK